MPARPDMDDEDEVEADMTPMIDVIFLLLVFFILTTKFIPEEKIISSLMPTDKGQSAASSPPIEEIVNANILIYPARLSNGWQPSEYDANWHANPFAREARFKINQIDQGIVVPIDVMGDKNLS